MLYLVKSHDIIKIGSTKDLHKRIIAYKTSNPDAEFLEKLKFNIFYILFL